MGCRGNAHQPVPSAARRLTIDPESVFPLMMGKGRGKVRGRSRGWNESPMSPFEIAQCAVGFSTAP